MKAERPQSVTTFKDLEKDNNFQKDLENKVFITRLSYHSDIFKAFNHLNLSFQGQNSTALDLV